MSAYRLGAAVLGAAFLGASAALAVAVTAPSFEDQFVQTCEERTPFERAGQPCEAAYVEAVCPDADSAAGVEGECIPGLEPSGAAVGVWLDWGGG